MASHDLQFAVNNGERSPYDGNISMNQIPSPNNQNINNGQPGMNDNGSVTSSTLQFVQNQLKQSSHPFVIVFHVFFKILSLFVYIFGGWFIGGDTGAEKGAEFITITVICILLLAADFWVVKNVTGRLLVGLRWWNKVEEEGTKWIFESAEGKRSINPFDRNVFWFVLYGTPFIWIILLILGIVRLRLNWLLIVLMALTLSGANVYGYYKCSTEQKQQTEQMMQRYASQGAVAIMKSNFLSLLTGSSAVASTNNTNMNINNASPASRNFV